MLRPNIDARGVSARRTMGAAALLLGAALAGWLLQSRATPWAMLLLLPVFTAAGLGFFQARRRTCVHYAARGVCDLGSGVQPVTDPEALEAMRRQAKRVWRDALVFAALVTLALLIAAFAAGA